MSRMTKYAAISEDIKQKFLSGDEGLIKSAAEGVTAEFQYELRENGIRRRITPPTMITADDKRLYYKKDSDFPSLLLDVDIQSAGAKLVPFETGPEGDAIFRDTVEVEMARIMTKLYSIDKVRLGGFRMPVLDVLKDLMLKDIMDEEDRITIEADRRACGEINKVNELTGHCHYVDAGAMERETLMHLPLGILYTQGNLRPNKMLMHEITYRGLANFKREEVGGDMSQDMFINGVTTTKIGGLDTIVTIKKDIVPVNDVYIYAEPKFYGGMYMMSDVTMVTEENLGIWYRMMAHEQLGFTIANIEGVCRARIGQGARVDWEKGL